VTLASERLVLQPVAPSDHASLHAMFTEPGVRRVIFDDAVIPPEQTEEIIAKSVALFAQQRFGLWIAFLKPGLESGPQLQGQALPIGFGGLWYFRDPPEVELLYGVSDRFIKRGYGREIAGAVVSYGFDVLGMREIRASTHPAHVDSRRVLEALGFTCERQEVVGGLDTAFYTTRRRG
jgi:ribosomal-protein-alanine N-acetyltransferase